MGNIKDQKRVYSFGKTRSEGDKTMKNLLGGKGANLAEMSSIGVPVPPGFTITTEACIEYNKLGKEKVVELIRGEVEEAISLMEKEMSTKFGSNENPLLVSVRMGLLPPLYSDVWRCGTGNETRKQRR